MALYDKTEIMIPEHKKDTVFFSSYFAKDDIMGIYSRVKQILDANGVANGLLRNTADYWARDYMPIQKSSHDFIGYVYGPDYLVGKEKFFSDYHKVTTSLKVNKTVEETDLTIDGGNVVAAGDGKVIMTEKVFVENPDIKKETLLRRLRELFESEVIILPWDKIDKYGHTDGIVRAVDNNSILVDFSVFPKRYADRMKDTLQKHYNVIELELPVKHRNSWAYINSLQTDHVIIIPGLGIESDKCVLEQYHKLFPGYRERIFMLEMADFVEEYGGALNCLTWTVKRKLALAS